MAAKNAKRSTPDAGRRKAKTPVSDQPKSEGRRQRAEVRSGDAGKPRTGKELLIVESPTKARTIGRLLEGKMYVLSSRGHISDLPKSRLGVNVEKEFEPDYIRIRGKAPVIRELQSAARQARAVYIACDPDREGEAIAYSVAFEIGATDGSHKDTNTNGEGRTAKSAKVAKGGDGQSHVKRVLLYEITPKGIKEAFAEPGEIDMNKVYSHRARRVLDRLVGYLVSPLLWKMVRGGLSAGRVQTVALRILAEREREIQAFRPEEYWTVKALFARSGGATFEAQLAETRGEDFKLKSGAEVEDVRKACAAASFVVSDVKHRDRARRPLPPFVTASMQQDAVQRLGFTARRAMQTAQQLFEGVDLAKETAGLITYPRTDSFRVGDAFLRDARQFIADNYGPKFLPDKPRHYPDKKGAQGAHEAIRPTRIERTPDSVKEFLTPEQFRLYDLIYRRFLASQMSDAVYSLTEVQVSGGDYTFKADALKCRFSGFEKVYGDPDKEKVLPALAAGEPVALEEFRPEQKFTQPPARYTEATLIKRLEVNGIGRPSTYATIVSTLFDRKYAERKEGRLHPTELGMLVHDILIPSFGNVFEIGFTREMEKELDLIEEGGEKWQEVVRRFYGPFKEDLDMVASGAAGVKKYLVKELDEKCPVCGANLAERWGRFGKFIACSRYPECKYIKKTAPKQLDEKCPQCGKPLVERKGRFGPFVACSGYPECKYVKKEAGGKELKPGDACPRCGKSLVEKTGRFGTFTGCSGYPDCRFIARAKPPEPKLLDEKCPQCGKPLVERKGRFGPFVACSGYPACKYVKKEKKRAGAAAGVVNEEG
jgi:DNA topoisomerase-1